MQVHISISSCAYIYMFICKYILLAYFSVDFPESRGSNNGYAAETHIDVNFREGRENGTRLRRPHSHGAADVINQRSVAAMLTDELPSRQLGE